MSSEALESILNFIRQLPGSLAELEKADIPWLLEHIRDDEVAARLTTLVCSNLAQKMGTKMVMKPEVFLMNLCCTMAILFEMEDNFDMSNLYPDEAIVAEWLGTIQAGPEEDAPAAAPSEVNEPDAQATFGCAHLLVDGVLIITKSRKTGINS